MDQHPLLRAVHTVATAMGIGAILSVIPAFLLWRFM